MFNLCGSPSIFILYVCHSRAGRFIFILLDKLLMFGLEQKHPKTIITVAGAFINKHVFISNCKEMNSCTFSNKYN